MTDMAHRELQDWHLKVQEEFEKQKNKFDLFCKNIVNFFQSSEMGKCVHSVRHRIKDFDHLIEKIERKNKLISSKGSSDLIDEKNFLSRITDIAGVRVLHLHLSQFESIHNKIMEKVEDEEFILLEEPKAYTWDMDSAKYFEKMGIRKEVKDSFYTSIHYVFRPNSKSPVTCEVQVRTLLEEAWGEIDHTMNYPKQIEDESCREQLKVLARLIGAGNHLADSIMKKYANKN